MKAFKLENEPKIESGFKTPDHYFEHLSARIIQQLPKEEPKVISFFQRRKTTIMLVAAVLILALMIPILNTFSIKSTELDTVTLENYLSSPANINQYDLINGLESEDINQMKNSLALEDETIENILSANSNTEHLIIE
jgi:hypothetical protein